MRPSLARALALALALVAGCTAKDEVPEAVQLPEDDLLAGALAQMPDVFTARLTARTANGTELTLAGTFDRAKNTTYVELGGDANTLAAVGGSSGAGTYLQRGLTIYQSPEGTMYLANGSAFVKPPDKPGTRRVGSTLPVPEQGPLAALLRADAVVQGFGAEGLRIESANATTWNGADALEMTLVNGTMRSTLVVTRADPPRLVHLATTLAPDPARPPSALDHATLVGTLHYDAAEILAPAPAASRSLALAYETKKTSGTLTWTFVGSGGIRLDEVEVQVKRPPPNATMVGDPALLATAWTFNLAETSRTVGNLTIAYHDDDADGAVSPGDTLVAAGGEPFPPFVLYDLATGVRIVPGAGLAVLLTALLGATLRNVETRAKK